VDAPACKFPGCAETAADDELALCTEHRRLLLDDPGEFRRLWGAIDPRPEALRMYTRSRGAGSAPREE
jgi:hypothetical protein